MPKRGNKIRIFLYFMLVGLLMVLLFLSTFKIVAMDTGFFTRFLVSLLFILLLLPLVPHIKLFDIVEVTRKERILAKRK